MAIDISLILSNPPSRRAAVTRLYHGEPQPENKAVILDSGVWILPEFDARGFNLRVLDGTTQAYFEADSDGEAWVWEPNHYTLFQFQIDKAFPRPTVYHSILELVSEVILGGEEDAALVQNGNFLLFKRSAGKLRLSTPTFWKNIDPKHIPLALQ